MRKLKMLCDRLGRISVCAFVIKRQDGFYYCYSGSFDVPVEDMSVKRLFTVRECEQYLLSLFR